MSDEKLSERHHIMVKSRAAQQRRKRIMNIMSDTADETPPKKCIFYDMKHSNNAARIRLWMRIKDMHHVVETILLTHDDLESDEYQKINPLKKVPSLITDHGLKLFEAQVILQYLEDRFGSFAPPSLVMDTPDDRALVNLIVRCHDLYIASPNSTQPNFTHTQGCMYLDPHPTAFTPAVRTMNVTTRASKLAEIFQQLSWLQDTIQLPYMVGKQMTHADVTWFPTAVFMELLLPLVFDWPPVFQEHTSFPKLTTWFHKCSENVHFSQTRQEIREILLEQYSQGRFTPVRQEVQEHPEYKWKYM
jgi:glutathione S-transferase